MATNVLGSQMSLLGSRLRITSSTGDRAMSLTFRTIRLRPSQQSHTSYVTVCMYASRRTLVFSNIGTSFAGALRSQWWELHVHQGKPKALRGIEVLTPYNRLTIALIIDVFTNNLTSKKPQASSQLPTILTITEGSVTILKGKNTVKLDVNWVYVPPWVSVQTTSCKSREPTYGTYNGLQTRTSMYI